jgi:FkbM family methyltransferase
MKLSFSTAILLRQPFRITWLPLSARIYAMAYGQTLGRIHKFILRPTARLVFKLFSNIWRDGDGRFLYDNKGSKKRILFRSKNTQFHSLYLPEYRYYEPETLALTDLLLSGEEVFYDIGSNWGHFTLHAASNPGYAGKIHSFEPMPATFGDLSSIVKQAGLENQVTCHCLALSDSDRPAYLHIPDGIHSGNATLSAHTEGIKIRQQKLDDLKLLPPFLMKVDAEGHEATIFSGGTRLMEEAKPFILFENFRDTMHPEKMLDPLLVLQKSGYLFYLPLFVDEWKGIPIHAGKQDCPPASAPEARLGLFEFLPEERCFLGEQINIFACHPDKLPLLERRMKGNV